MGYRMRAVFSDEPRFVDSSAITASHMAVGIHVFRILLLDGVTCELPAFFGAALYKTILDFWTSNGKALRSC